MKGRLIAIIALTLMLLSFVSCDKTDTSNIKQSISSNIFSETEHIADELKENLMAYVVENANQYADEANTKDETSEATDISVKVEEDSAVENIEADNTTTTEPVIEAETVEVTATIPENSAKITSVIIPEAIVDINNENVVSEPPSQEKETVPDASNCDYVLNKNSKKIHYPTCGSVKKMAAHNTLYFIGTRDEALAMGYNPCGRCTP